MNMIMEECHERVYSSDAGVEQACLVCTSFVVMAARSLSLRFSLAFRLRHKKKNFLVQCYHGELDEELDRKLDLVDTGRTNRSVVLSMDYKFINNIRIDSL